MPDVRATHVQFWEYSVVRSVPFRSCVVNDSDIWVAGCVRSFLLPFVYGVGVGVQGWVGSLMLAVTWRP